MTDWVAAVKTMRGHVGVYLGKPKLNAKQQAALQTDLKTLDKDLAGLETYLAGLTEGGVSADLFKPAGDDDATPYIVGGSPGNPNGVSFTNADARKWWETVFAGGLNISKVRPTLLPGSSVLSAEGYALAVKLGAESETYAPEGYNPLDLPVVP